MTARARVASARVALRPPSFVMRLSCLGAFHQTRLSFMRSLLRRLRAEKWRFSRPLFALDARGVGRAVYRAQSGDGRVFSLVAFARDLPAAASLRPRHRNRLGRRLRAFRRRSDDGGFGPPRPPRAAPRGGAIHRARVGVVARESKRALVFALRRSLGGGVATATTAFARSRLSYAHDRGLRQRQIRLGRPRHRLRALRLAGAVSGRIARGVARARVRRRLGRAFGARAQSKRRRFFVRQPPLVGDRKFDRAWHGAFFDESSGAVASLDSRPRNGFAKGARGAVCRRRRRRIFDSARAHANSRRAMASRRSDATSQNRALANRSGRGATTGGRGDRRAAAGIRLERFVSLGTRNAFVRRARMFGRAFDRAARRDRRRFVRANGRRRRALFRFSGGDRRALAPRARAPLWLGVANRFFAAAPHARDFGMCRPKNSSRAWASAPPSRWAIRNCRSPSRATFARSPAISRSPPPPSRWRRFCCAIRAIVMPRAAPLARRFCLTAKSATISSPPKCCRSICCAASCRFSERLDFDPRSDRWLRIAMYQNAPYPDEFARRARRRLGAAQSRLIRAAMQRVARNEIEALAKKSRARRRAFVGAGRGRGQSRPLARRASRRRTRIVCRNARSALRRRFRVCRSAFMRRRLATRARGATMSFVVSADGRRRAVRFVRDAAKKARLRFASMPLRVRCCCGLSPLARRAKPRWRSNGKARASSFSRAR